VVDVPESDGPSSALSSGRAEDCSKVSGPSYNKPCGRKVKQQGASGICAAECPLSSLGR